MSELARRNVLASALSAAAGWLVEPAQPAEADGERSPTPLDTRPIVAVVGTSPRCGATTVARALGAELGARDPAGACVVTATATAGALPLGLPGSVRLARTLSPLLAGRARACGRLCVVEAPDRARLADAARYVAPLVFDVEDPAEAPAAVGLADHVLLVGRPVTEPALVAVLAESLRRVGPAPLAVLNRAGHDAGRWRGRAQVELPDSRMGAQLALAGREPRGQLGRAVAELADRCERVV